MHILLSNEFMLSTKQVPAFNNFCMRMLVEFQPATDNDEFLLTKNGSLCFIACNFMPTISFKPLSRKNLSRCDMR